MSGNRVVEALKVGRTNIYKNWGKGPDLTGKTCAITAMSHVLGTDLLQPALDCLTDAGNFRYFGNIAPWNDAALTTHADVLALYDKAIAIAEFRVVKPARSAKLLAVADWFRGVVNGVHAP